MANRIPKVISGRNYGSIPHLLDSKLGFHDRYLDPGQDRIIRRGGRDRHDVVTASLKLDGTNVGVVKLGGQLTAIQRKGYACASSPYRQHHEFDGWMHEHYARFDSLLREGERVVGEWLWQASGIRYRIEGAPFVAFDFFDAVGERLTSADFADRLTAAGFDLPPYVQYRKGNTPELGQALLERLGARSRITPVGESHEGLVFRVERRGAFDYMGKWVRADFEAGRWLPSLGEEQIVRNEIVK